MIAKYSEHIDTEVNADQKYKRHTELRCPVATSDKCTPHQICIQGLKYIRNILKSVFFSGADLLRKKIGEQQVNCSPSLKHPPVTLRCSPPSSLLCHDTAELCKLTDQKAHRHPSTSERYMPGLDIQTEPWLKERAHDNAYFHIFNIKQIGG